MLTECPRIRSRRILQIHWISLLSKLKRELVGVDQVKTGRSRPFQLWTKEDAIDRFRFNVWRTKGTMEMDVKKEEWSFEVFGYEVSET